MNDFRQNFLAESINNLSTLNKKLAEDSGEDLRRDAFRLIHTIKGGSQTFGLKNAAKLAGELENILADRENFDHNNQNLLLEGIELLSNSLRSGETNLSADFIEKLQTINQTATKSDILLTRIPPKVFKNLSNTEQNAAISALRRRENILCAEVGFELSNFADEYRNLRKELSEKSEIIAALPSAKFNSSGKIGFQLFLASRENKKYLQELLANYRAEIVSHTCADSATNDLFEMFSRVAAHGENIANQLGKEIGFTVLASETKLSAETIKILFDILLHLVRNAVDHGVEKSGKIEIQLFDDDEQLHLTVADNGNGIDLAKIRARAIEKNLISDDDVLNDQQTLELIFASELSTAATPTEISGRGIGLDAVKYLVEKSNGKISVKSRKTFGTIFEIFLPIKEMMNHKDTEDTKI